MNCWTGTGVLKDFDSRTEAMGLNCPCGNAEGIKFKDLVSLGQILVLIGMLSFLVTVPLCEVGSAYARL